MIDLKNVLEIERNNKIVQKIQTTEKRLPSEYQEVEYLESTGQQYIDTGFEPNQDTKIETKYITTNNFDNTQFLYGARMQPSPGVYTTRFAFLNAVNNKVRIDYNDTYFIPTDISIRNEHTIIQNKNISYIDDSKIETDLSYQNFNCSFNIFIFGVNTDGEITGNAYAKIYYFKIWDNGTLIRHLIPCYRKSDNKSGMYDLVSNTFFSNKGSTEFNLGQEIDNCKTIYEGYKTINGLGKAPISIKNSGNPAINYRIYGNLNRPDTPSKDNPATIYTVGDLVTDASDSNYGKYKIPVRATGKNLLPELIKGRGVNSATGEITTSNLYATSDFIEVDMDNFYCFSGLTDKCMSMAYAYNENKEYLGRTSGVATTERYFDKTYFYQSTTGIGGDIKYIIVGQYVPYTRPDDIKYVDDIKPQLELGKEPTFFEPYKVPITTNIYLDEPLRRVTNQYETKIDYIDFANQKVYRNMAEKIFTGNESWGKVSSASNLDYFRYYMGGGGRIYGSLSSLSQFCNYFVWGGPTTGNQQMGISLYVSSDNNYIRIRDSELTTATLIQNFMKEKYEAGNPVRFVYTTKTQREENVTLPAILLQKGINVISIGTELQPSDFYIKYKGKGQS